MRMKMTFIIVALALALPTATNAASKKAFTPRPVDPCARACRSPGGNPSMCCVCSGGIPHRGLGGKIFCE